MVYRRLAAKNFIISVIVQDMIRNYLNVPKNNNLMSLTPFYGLEQVEENEEMKSR